jgi:hypothetical protein
MKDFSNDCRELDKYLSEVSPEPQPIHPQLKKVFLDEVLTEEFKWGGPCYGYKVLVSNIGLLKKCAVMSCL